MLLYYKLRALFYAEIKFADQMITRQGIFIIIFWYYFITFTPINVESLLPSRVLGERSCKTSFGFTEAWEMFGHFFYRVTKFHFKKSIQNIFLVW